MLEFVLGPHGETISQKQKDKIVHAFSSDYYNRINTFYNIPNHFGTAKYNGDVTSFLREIESIVDSKYHKLQIMGDIHTDPYGHSSYLIGQYDDYNVFIPAIVKDNYVRFKVVQDPKHYKMLRSIDDTRIFHFLMTPPSIVQIYDIYRPTYMNYVDKDIAPITRYKRINIQYI